MGGGENCWMCSFAIKEKQPNQTKFVNKVVKFLSTKCEEQFDFACCVVYANTPLELLMSFPHFKRKLVVWDAIWKGTLFKTQLGFGVQFWESHIVQTKLGFRKSHCSKQNQGLESHIVQNKLRVWKVTLFKTNLGFGVQLERGVSYTFHPLHLVYMNMCNLEQLDIKYLFPSPTLP